MLHSLQSSLDIIVDLGERSIAGTKIMERAQVYGMSYMLMERAIRLDLQIYPHAYIDGTQYGESLANDPGFRVRSETIKASNQYLVDVAPGHEGEVLGRTEELLAPIPNPDVPGEFIEPFEPGHPLEGKEVKKNYDFFKDIAAGAPVIIDQLLTMQVLAAKQRGDI
jgi:hypothetical protein